MVAHTIRLSALPVLGGAASAFVAAAAVVLLPADALASMIEGGGLPALFEAARPPLGGTARALLALGAATASGAVAWAALFLLFGPGGPFAREGGEDGMPVTRSADAHPDAPPRRPLGAVDLRPPAPPPAECPLPADLDLPIAAFHPAALPPVPREPARPVPPLAPPREPLRAGERISSVELPPARSAESGAPSIESLLARLERGAERTRTLRHAG